MSKRPKPTPRPKFKRIVTPRRRVKKTPITEVGTCFQHQSRITLSPKDHRNHTHIIGSTGTGKSKIMELMMRQDLKNRRVGFCLLDPHGTLYEDILMYASHKCPHMADRVILFNPAEEIEQVVGFNPIPDNASEFLDYNLDMLISAILKAWGQDRADYTPRITKWLENIFYTIIANDLTMLETTPLLSISKRYKEKRERLLSNVGSDIILDDWDMFNTSTNTQKQSLIEGAANRLRKFLRNEAIRNSIGQKNKTLNLLKIMNEGKILLVNLNGRHRISRENTKLLGVMLVNEFFRVATLRDTRDPKLRPFHLYIDEFANFITKDIARSLEECRKFKLFLTLAHQHLAQLKEEDEYLYASVLTNCKNKIVFGGLTKEDATIMTDEIATGFVGVKEKLVKDEIYQTKFRPIEETRIVRSSSKSQSQGETESISEGWSRSQTIGSSDSVGYAHTIGSAETIGAAKTIGSSDSVGSSQSFGNTDSVGLTRTQGISDTSGSSEQHGISSGSGRGNTSGQTNGQGASQAKGITSGLARSFTSGISNMLGGSDSNSSSHTRGHAETNSSSHGHSSSNTSGKSLSSGFSHGSGRNESYTRPGNNRNESRSTNSGRNMGNAKNTSSTSGTNHSTGHSLTRSESDTRGGSRGANWSDSQNQSHGNTVNESLSNSLSRNQNNSRSLSHTDNQNQGQSRTSGNNKSRSLSQSDSVNAGHTVNRNTGVNQSHTASQSQTLSKSHTQSRSDTTSQTHTISRSETSGTFGSRTYGRTQSVTEGEGISVVPYDRKEEFQELSSRTFWTKDELHYMAMADLKNQETGEAFIKIGNDSPIQAKIDYVSPVKYNRRTSPKRVDAFREKVFQENGEYYTPALEARHEYEDRQRRIFGEPLRFDEKPLVTGHVVESEDGQECEEELFNE